MVRCRRMRTNRRRMSTRRLLVVKCLVHVEGADANEDGMQPAFEM